MGNKNLYYRVNMKNIYIIALINLCFVHLFNLPAGNNQAFAASSGTTPFYHYSLVPRPQITRNDIIAFGCALGAYGLFLSFVAKEAKKDREQLESYNRILQSAGIRIQEERGENCLRTYFSYSYNRDDVQLKSRIEQAKSEIQQLKDNPNTTRYIKRKIEQQSESINGLLNEMGSWPAYKDILSSVGVTIQGQRVFYNYNLYDLTLKTRIEQAQRDIDTIKNGLAPTSRMKTEIERKRIYINSVFNKMIAVNLGYAALNRRYNCFDPDVENQTNQDFEYLKLMLNTNLDWSLRLRVFESLDTIENSYRRIREQSQKISRTFEQLGFDAQQRANLYQITSERQPAHLPALHRLEQILHTNYRHLVQQPDSDNNESNSNAIAKKQKITQDYSLLKWIISQTPLGQLRKENYQVIANCMKDPVAHVLKNNREQIGQFYTALALRKKPPLALANLNNNNHGQ